jgi:methylenetetrahydrofolate dehydrogenase (NADP+)/methenyltetrahydrofolate cyclohydrolase
MGRGRFLKKEYFKKDAIVIDVGITRLSSAELIGDVDFENVKNHVAYITPVPGGVGPMTIAYLMVNSVMAARIMGYNK